MSLYGWWFGLFTSCFPVSQSEIMVMGPNMVNLTTGVHKLKVKKKVNYKLQLKITLRLKKILLTTQISHYLKYVNFSVNWNWAEKKFYQLKDYRLTNTRYTSSISCICNSWQFKAFQIICLLFMSLISLLLSYIHKCDFHQF